jgi:hypothetical protein
VMALFICACYSKKIGPVIVLLLVWWYSLVFGCTNGWFGHELVHGQVKVVHIATFVEEYMITVNVEVKKWAEIISIKAILTRRLCLSATHVEWFA